MRRTSTLTAFYAVLAILLVGLWPSQASAQRLQTDAIAGTPFGVGRITVSASSADAAEAWASGRIDLTEANSRVLFPVHATGPARKLLRQFVEGSSSSLTIWFLFTGNEPLDLTFYGPNPVKMRLTPRSDPRNFHARYLTSWWRGYSQGVSSRSRSAGYPGMVDTYLSSTLARRLSLAPPLLGGQGLLGRKPADPSNEGLGVLLGSEAIRNRFTQEMLLKNGPENQVATQALPEPISFTEKQYPGIQGEVAIEPIAMRVPQEFLYVRCGTFANFVWMNTLIDDWGGNLRNLISEQGIDYGLRARNEKQLAMRQTALSKTFGGTLISDVAILAGDTFMREGAAMGMLFEARNNFLLTSSLGQERTAAKKAGPKEETLDIAGQKVSFLSTEDGSVRSYYVVVGDYHLITTSRTMVERFIEVSDAKGKGSLGASDEFRYARTLLPIAREDTLFVYLSDALFKNLSSPHHRIEMRRRMRSMAEIEAFRLAQLAAKAEGKPGDTIQQLIASNMLPVGFGARPDGSQMVFEKDGFHDSLRGTPGLFVPVADMPVEKISDIEARDYASFASNYGNSLARMEPLTVAIRRHSTEVPGRERVEIEAHIPQISNGQMSGIRRWLGPPTRRTISPLPGEVVRLDVVGPQGNNLFLGIEEFEPPIMIRDGQVQWGMPSFDALHGYMGGSPSLGLLQAPINLLGGAPNGPANGRGVTRSGKGLWYRAADDMTVVSFNSDVLAGAVQDLHPIEAERPAQVRLHIEDLSQTQMAGAIHALGFQRAHKVSVAGTGFLHSLARQLHVPREECLTVAEDLLHADMHCTLGGEYQLDQRDGQLPRWISTAWGGENHDELTRVPDGYEFPVMQWFRGLDLEFSAVESHLTLRADIDMQHRSQQGGGFAIPGLSVPPATKPSKETKPAEVLPAPKLEVEEDESEGIRI